MRALALATLLAFTSIAAHAADLECGTEGGTETILAHKEGADKKPYLSLELRGISWRCIEGGSVYKFHAFPEIPFKTEAQAKEAVDLLLKLNRLGVKPEQVAAALKAAAEIQTKSDAPAVVAKK